MYYAPDFSEKKMSKTCKKKKKKIKKWDILFTFL